MFRGVGGDGRRKAALEAEAATQTSTGMTPGPVVASQDGRGEQGPSTLPENKIHGMSDRRRKAPVGFVCLAAVALAAYGAAPGLSGWQRSPENIRLTLAASPHQGLCDECHSAHSGSSDAHPLALIGPDDNTLCDGCHTTPWKGDSYGGNWIYAGSAHGSSPSAIWPGPVPPARTSATAAGQCLNCHDPHGQSDADGVIPSLLVAREEGLCLTCHDGQPASTDIRSDLQKAFHHPVTEYTGRHAGASESSPTSFGASPLNNRHSECADCHDSHVARTDPQGGPLSPDAPKSILGVSRVAVINGGAGSIPTYTFVPGQDTLSSSPAEYQLCFKCHSSWTYQPGGQTDMALAFNPNNSSYHPVEAAGKNPGIHPLSFAGGMDATSIVQCGSCHGSDFGSVRGPHGSSYRYILKRSYTASSASHMTTSDELCFTCHSYDVYGNRNAPDPIRAYSRFNKPGADKGHAEHVGEENIPCYACHASHGSPDQKHLLVTGRSPGIMSYTETPTGGTCSPTCHSPQSYQVNYAR